MPYPPKERVAAVMMKSSTVFAVTPFDLITRMKVPVPLQFTV